MEQQVTRSKIDVLKSIMDAPSIQQQFKNAMKENSGSFIASLIDLYGGDASLQKCEPQRVVQEALKAAVLKLPITKALGFAYIIVFNTNTKDSNGNWEKIPTPNFIPGYKGYIQLAMRTGQYKTINTDVVYEGEIQKMNKLTGEIRFDGEKTSEKIIGYFAYFELMNGFSKTLYISLDDMAKHAKKYSPTISFDKAVTVETLKALANSKTSSGKVGWLGNFNDMALKTCVRNLLSKYGYLSVEMMNVVSADNEDMQYERDKALDEIQPKRINVTEAVVVEEEKPTTENAPY